MRGRGSRERTSRPDGTRRAQAPVNRRARAPGLGAVLAFAASAACASHSPHGTEPGADPAAVVVGVQTEQASGALGTLHVVTTLRGATNTDEILTPSQLPHEVKLRPPGDDLTAPIGVRVEGYSEAGWTPRSQASAVVVRTARARFVPSRTVLLRVPIEGQCLLGLPGGPPGGPTCDAPQTCVDGACQDDTVPSGALEPYSPDWPDNGPDACRPAGAGPPVVQVGTGESDYLPVVDGQTVQVEQGPQGGHHIWIAVRQHNLKQTGSTTTITSVQPGTGLVGPRMAFVFTFAPDEGGFCKLAGLRYQLDLGGGDYHAFLGQPLDVSVTIAQQDGTTGTGIAHLNLAPTVLCPTGIPGCP